MGSKCKFVWKKNTDDVNHCLHNKSGSHGVANANSFDFIVLLVDCHLLRTNSDAFSKEEYILGILTVVVCCNRFITFTFDFYGLLSAKQRRNLCFGPPPVYQDLSTRHEWSVHVKEAFFTNQALWICQSGWKEIQNAFQVIRWIHWRLRTRSSGLLRRRY